MRVKTDYIDYDKVDEKNTREYGQIVQRAAPRILGAKACL